MALPPGAVSLHLGVISNATSLVQSIQKGAVSLHLGVISNQILNFEQSALGCSLPSFGSHL